MVLLTNKPQGSHILFPLSSPTWPKDLTVKRPISTVHFVGRKEKYLLLKKQTCSYSLGPKSFRVTSFKGSERGKKFTNNSVNLSYRSQDRSLSYTSGTEDSNTGRPAFQKLFKKWLTLLRSQSPIQVIDEALVGEDITEIQKTESLQSTKVTVLSWFGSQEASIKIPLLLFVPAFLAVKAIYGAEVTKELTPLWIFGPLFVALYIKMFQGLCALYAFSFNQTVKMLRNLPFYYLVAYRYVSQGKLRDDVRGLVTRRVLAIKNTDYRELASSKVKQLREWIFEKYLDFVESIWPYYCRTIRFLKRANLI